MAYVESQLLPGEKILHQSKLHWQLFILPGFFAVICFLCALGAIAGRSIGIGLLLIVFAAGLILFAYLRQMSSEFAVTDRRLIVKLGIITTRTLELVLSKVETVSVNQGIMGRMLNFGDIVVTGTGGTREMFKNVDAPMALRRAVQAAIPSA